MNLKRIFSFLFFASIISITPSLWAKGSAHNLGAGFISSNPAQDDIDLLIERANTSAGGISTKSMGSAYEFMINYTYKFKGSMFGMQFRPSYFYQSTKGTGGGNSYNYVLSGYTLFPVFTLTPLENKFIKFYMQIGVGYGRLNGTIDEAATTISFSGANFGGMAGVGSEFCFVDEHCINFEGNMRYLPIDRNIASSVTGTMANLTRADKQREVEIDDSDLKTTLSGFQGLIGYTYHF